MLRATIIVFVIAVGLLFLLPSSSDAQYAGPSHQHWNRQASWYGPGFYGRRTACGQTLQEHTSWWVAALKTDLKRCGLKVRICQRHRCVNVQVKDSGASRSDRRDWDLTPRVKRALHCPGLCEVNWKKGWT